MFRRVLPICTILCLLLFTLSLAPVAPVTAAVGPVPYSGIHASGGNLVDAAGLPVTLHGVDRSGGEFGCVQSGASMWNGPMDQTMLNAILAWKANAIRVPLNEDCWLGINGANPGGSTYQNNVVTFVNLAISNGMYVILDLHWGAAGSTLATAQTPMPDSDHSPAFWTGVATTFKNNGNVIFDLFNEPYPGNNSESSAAWACWRDGSSCGSAGVGYTAVGMQSLVNTVRATGANNLIMLGGIEYSNDLQQWLAYEPTDSANNLAASWHSYNFNVCNNSSCWNSYIATVKAKVPVIAGEMGENDCADSYVNPLMTWLDGEGISYLGWTWNATDAGWNCSSGPSLITDYNGTPTAFGQGFHDHYIALAGGGSKTNTPVPTTVHTNTPVPTTVHTNTPVPTTPVHTNTPTHTNTPGGATATRTPTFAAPTSTPGSGGGTCSPVNATITAPFTYDGTGTLCWKSNSLGSYINDWNLVSLSINGVDETNKYIASAQYPTKASDGYWYISYNSTVAWGHFETK